MKNLRLNQFTVITFFFMIAFIYSHFSHCEAVIKSGMKKPNAGALYIPFIENRGQSGNSNIRFYTESAYGNIYIGEKGEIVYLIPFNASKEAGGIVKGRSYYKFGEKPVGAAGITITGGDTHITNIHFIKGSSSGNAVNGVETYRSITFGELYDNIEMRLISKAQGVEKLFSVKAGGNPDLIRFVTDKSVSLRIGQEGELMVITPSGTISFTKPLAYQESNHGERKTIDISYYVKDNEYGFITGKYDRNKELIIDPLLSSTFIGGADEDQAWLVSLDKDRNVYVSGRTYSVDFPTLTGSYEIIYSNSADIFVSRFDESLVNLLSSTFIGGSGDDDPAALYIDDSGKVFISGRTTSDDFPVSTGAYGTVYNGSADAFVLSLDSSLSNLSASTLLGGTDSDSASSVITDSSGSVYIAGGSSSSDFPVTTGAYSTIHNGREDAFITVLDSTLSAVTASTFIGGAGNDHAYALKSDSTGTLYITGTTDSSDFPVTDSSYSAIYSGGGDIFVTAIDGALSDVTASTFLGGSSEEAVPAIDISDSGGVYVVGATDSSDFPVTATAYDTTYDNTNTQPDETVGGDGFISKFDATLSTLSASTFLGGSDQDQVESIYIESGTGIFVSGVTFSSTFPVSANAYGSEYSGGGDGFVAKLTGTLSTLTASTFVGGADLDSFHSLTGDDDKNIYVTGFSSSSDFPVKAYAYDPAFNGAGDGVVVKFDTSFTTTTESVVNTGGLVIDYTGLSIYSIDTETDTSSGPFLSYMYRELNDIEMAPDQDLALVSAMSNYKVVFLDTTDITNITSVSEVDFSSTPSASSPFQPYDITITPDGNFALLSASSSKTSEGEFSSSSCSYSSSMGVASVDMRNKTLTQYLTLDSPKQSDNISADIFGNVFVGDYCNKKLYLLQIDTTTGLLTDTGIEFTLSFGPVNSYTSPKGDNLIVTGWGGIVVFRTDGLGDITELQNITDYSIQSAAYSPDGKTAYFGDINASPDRIVVMDINTDGTLTPNGTEFTLDTNMVRLFLGIDTISLNGEGTKIYAGNMGNPDTEFETLPVTGVMVIDLSSGNAGTVTLGESAMPTALAFQGTTQLPDIVVNPPSVDFGSALLDTTNNISVIVANLGKGGLEISDITTPAAPFSLVSETCTDNVIPYTESCTISLSFAPDSEGTFNDTIIITSNDRDNPSLTLTLTGAATDVTGQFVLTINKDGTGEGTVTGSLDLINCGVDCTALFEEGTEITLTAAPNQFSNFAGWTGGGCSGTAECHVVITEDITITATFDSVQVPLQKTLTVQPVGSGTGIVTDSLGGINCGSDCTELYNIGTEVVLSASPDSGSEFEGWSGGGCSGTGECILIMEEDITVNASFNIIETPEIRVLPAAVEFGEVGITDSLEVKLRAGNAGRGILEITELSTPSSPFTIQSEDCTGKLMVFSEFCTITITFSPLDTGAFNDTIVITSNDPVNPAISVTLSGTGGVLQHTLTVQKSGSGIVFDSLGGINCGEDCTEKYDEGSEITLSAVPDSGYRFAGWSGGGCSGTGSCVVILNQDTTVSASFSPASYTLTIEKDGTGDGTVTDSLGKIDCGSDCNAEYDYNTEVTLTAVSDSDSDSSFLGWSGGGCSGADNCKVTMTTDRTVVATFGIPQYLVTVIKSGSGSGLITDETEGVYCGSDCEELFEIGSDVVLQFTPDNDSRVTNVIIDGTAIGGVYSLTLSNIGEEHVIEVEFSK